jgi:CDP-diacylglycerol---glycerol-3-phosphate 3-phosphatidyltransferase
VTLPNQITLARLALTVPFVATFYAGSRTTAFVLFILASLTDLLDGYLARRQGLESNFGKLFDTLADKILMAAALTMLAVERSIPSWIVITILGREFFVTGIRQIAISQGIVLAAERLGKHKMVWQVITVIYFLLLLASAEGPLAFTRNWFAWRPLSPEVFGHLTIWITTLLTLASGMSYFWKNRRLFADA